MTVHFYGQKSIPKKNILLRFAKRVCRKVKPLRRPGEIGIIFVTDRKIRGINRRFLGHPNNTDVISFNYLESNLIFGDIYISTDTAARQARAGGHSLVQELALLIVHGLLHLSGYEDDTPRRQSRMFQKQSRLFRSIDSVLAPPDFR